MLTKSYICSILLFFTHASFLLLFFSFSSFLLFSFSYFFFFFLPNLSFFCIFFSLLSTLLSSFFAPSILHNFHSFLYISFFIILFILVEYLIIGLQVVVGYNSYRTKHIAETADPIWKSNAMSFTNLLSGTYMLTRISTESFFFLLFLFFFIFLLF